MKMGVYTVRVAERQTRFVSLAMKPTFLIVEEAPTAQPCPINAGRMVAIVLCYCLVCASDIPLCGINKYRADDGETTSIYLGSWTPSCYCSKSMLASQFCGLFGAWQDPYCIRVCS